MNTGIQHDTCYHLHILRHQDEEGAGEFQRGQIHRLHNVHHVYHLARIYSHLLRNGKLIRGIENQVGRTVLLLFSRAVYLLKYYPAQVRLKC